MKFLKLEHFFIIVLLLVFAFREYYWNKKISDLTNKVESQTHKIKKEMIKLQKLQTVSPYQLLEDYYCTKHEEWIKVLKIKDKHRIEKFYVKPEEAENMKEFLNSTASSYSAGKYEVYGDMIYANLEIHGQKPELLPPGSKWYPYQIMETNAEKRVLTFKSPYSHRVYRVCDFKGSTK